MRRREDITLVGRAALMLVGLAMASTWRSSLSGHWVLFGLGVTLFLAGIGAIELAQALWYVARRHWARRQRAHQRK